MRVDRLEYLPYRVERTHHVRKRYAYAGCEHKGDHPRMKAAAKPQVAVDRSMTGPGQLPYIATSGSAAYLPICLDPP